MTQIPASLNLYLSIIFAASNHDKAAEIDTNKIFIFMQRFVFIVHAL